MRRFERLRKLARQLAAELGHDLGNFQKLPALYGQPVSPGWWAARCLKCGEMVMIGEKPDPHNNKGCDPYMAPIEGRAMMLAKSLNAKTGDDKLPFPKRSKGVFCGKAVERECPGVVEKKE